MPGSVSRPPTDATFTIDPPCSAIDAFHTSRVHSTGPYWLSRTVFSARTASMSTSGPKYGFVPALLTSTSTRPNRPIAASTQAAAWSGSAAWAAYANTPTDGYAVAIVAATSSRADWVREVSTTLQPSAANAAAVAAPMPRDAPVTITVRMDMPHTLLPAGNVPARDRAAQYYPGLGFTET